MTDAAVKRRILIGCYFPRSVELEGVGSLLFGLARSMASRAWHVDLLLPDGAYTVPPGVGLSMYVPGFAGLSRYRAKLRSMSAGTDAVLLLENNPNMAASANASLNTANTFSFFCTPLQTLRLLAELGPTRQAVAHALFKHILWARLIDWSRLRCIVGSRYQADQLAALGAGNVHMMPVCGLSRDACVPDRASARSIMGWDDKPTVGYLGHFSPAKGVGVLLEAFAEVCDGAVLAIAHSGKGTLKPAHARMLDKMLSAGRARLLSTVDPVVFLAACDVVALPYITTSIFHQPQVLLESFAASTPVITTSIGGFGELVRPQVTGALVPPRDSAALAAAISDMTSDLDGSREKGRAARLVFEQSFCTESFIDAFSGLIK